MNRYGLKIIDLTDVHTVDEHLEACRNSKLIYCNGLQELFDKCGMKLKRERNGYCVMRGNIEYQAVRVPSFKEVRAMI